MPASGVAGDAGPNNHFLAVGFQSHNRIVFFSNVYDSSLGRTVEVLQRSRLLTVEDVESKANTGIARIVFKTKRERPFGEGKTLESRLEHVSRVCLMFDLLTDIGWRPATSGSFMQERFKSTFVLSLGAPWKGNFGCTVEDGASQRYVIVPKSFDLPRAYSSLPKSSRRFLSGGAQNSFLDFTERGNFLTVQCLSHGHRESRDMSVSNILGLSSTLEHAGLEIGGTFNPFGDRTDSVVFFHDLANEDDSGSALRSAADHDCPVLWGVGLSPPPSSFSFTSPDSAASSPAPHQPVSKTKSSSGSFHSSSKPRRRSSAFRLDTSSSSSVNPSPSSPSASASPFWQSDQDPSCSVSMNDLLGGGAVGKSDHFDDEDNPLRLRFFNHPPGVKTLVLRSAHDALTPSEQQKPDTESASGLVSTSSAPSPLSLSSVWSCKSVAGKEVAAQLVRDMFSHGWRLRFGLNGVFDHSILVFGRDRRGEAELGLEETGEEDEGVLRQSTVGVDVLHISVLSNKKLCVGMMPKHGTKRMEAALLQSKLVLDILPLVKPLSGNAVGRKESIGDGGKKGAPPPSFQSVKKANADPAVFRFPPMTFNCGKQGGFEVILRLVSGLWHHGWRLEASANVSGLRPPTGATGEGDKKHSWTHSVFMVKAHREHLLQTPSYTPAVHVMHVHLYPKDAEEEEDGKNGATDR